MSKEAEPGPNNQANHELDDDSDWIVIDGQKMVPMAKIAHLWPRWQLIHIFDFMIEKNPPEVEPLPVNPSTYPDPTQMAEIYGRMLKHVYEQTHAQLGLPPLDSKDTDEEDWPQRALPADIPVFASTCIQDYLRHNFYVPTLDPGVKRNSRQYEHFWRMHAEFSDALDWECVRIFGVEIPRD